MEQDENFYYIAGYTSGGFPYGVTWQEMGLEPFQEEDEIKRKTKWSSAFYLAKRRYFRKF